jgi:hypothetical protein
MRRALDRNGRRRAEQETTLNHGGVKQRRNGSAGDGAWLTFFVNLDDIGW